MSFSLVMYSGLSAQMSRLTADPSAGVSDLHSAILDAAKAHGVTSLDPVAATLESSGMGYKSGTKVNM